MSVELRYLKYFVTVAELESFSAAARQLHVAQPAISQQIKILEEELGVILLQRTKRSVQITEAGAIFYQEARDILQRTDNAARIVQRAARGEVGRLSIGYFSSASSFFMPELIRTFCKQFPEVQLQLTDLGPRQLVEQLEQGNLDLIFTRPLAIEQAQQWSQQVLYEDQYYVAMYEDHPLAHKQTVSLKALADNNFILFHREESPAMYSEILQACVTSGFTPHIQKESNLMQSVLTYVDSGLGISILPGCVRNLQTGNVVLRKLRPKLPALSLNLVYAPQPTPVVTAFCKVVKQAEPMICKLARR